LWIFHSEYIELIELVLIDYQEVKIQLKCDLTKKQRCKSVIFAFCVSLTKKAVLKI